MTTPGFTADESLFRSRRHYAASHYAAHAMNAASVSPAQLNWCRSSDGEYSCGCPCGCSAEASSCECMPCTVTAKTPTFL